MCVTRILFDSEQGCIQTNSEVANRTLAGSTKGKRRNNAYERQLSIRTFLWFRYTPERTTESESGQFRTTDFCQKTEFVRNFLSPSIKLLPEPKPKRARWLDTITMHVKCSKSRYHLDPDGATYLSEFANPQDSLRASDQLLGVATQICSLSRFRDQFRMGRRHEGERTWEQLLAPTEISKAVVVQLPGGQPFPEVGQKDISHPSLSERPVQSEDH